MAPNASSEDQIDMASATQSRFRILMHEPRKKGKDDSLLTKVAIDAVTW